LLNLQILEKDNKYVSMKGDYCYWKNGPKKYVKLLIKDSYRLIPMRLASIPKDLDFKEKAQKEIMYYNMYSYKTMDHIKQMTEQELMEYIKEFNDNSHDSDPDLSNEEKAKRFWKNLEDWKCVNTDGTYDLLAYSKIYCHKDCEVLEIGMEKWAELWKTIDKRIDIHDFYSLPSLADYYLKSMIVLMGVTNWLEAWASSFKTLWWAAEQ